MHASCLAGSSLSLLIRWPFTRLSCTLSVSICRNTSSKLVCSLSSSPIQRRHQLKLKATQSSSYYWKSFLVLWGPNLCLFLQHTISSSCLSPPTSPNHCTQHSQLLTHLTLWHNQPLFLSTTTSVGI